MVYFSRERIRMALDQRGQTQKQLADIIGRGRETVAGWIKGTSNPSAADIAAMCNALEIEPNYLYPDVVAVNGERR